jgi:hypothetical protein
VDASLPQAAHKLTLTTLERNPTITCRTEPPREDTGKKLRSFSVEEAFLSMLAACDSHS